MRTKKKQKQKLDLVDEKNNKLMEKKKRIEYRHRLDNPFSIYI